MCVGQDGWAKGFRSWGNWFLSPCFHMMSSFLLTSPIFTGKKKSSLREMEADILFCHLGIMNILEDVLQEG